MEKMLDMIADFILGIGTVFFKWFGGRDDVKAVQEKVVGMCGFLPTATSVAAMLAAPNPVVTGVVGIAQAICAVASANRSVSLVSTTAGTVNGVPVEGDWIVKKGIAI